jgi:hypothetical protein
VSALAARVVQPSTCVTSMCMLCCCIDFVPVLPINSPIVSGKPSAVVLSFMGELLYLILFIYNRVILSVFLSLAKGCLPLLN